MDTEEDKVNITAGNCPNSDTTTGDRNVQVPDLSAEDQEDGTTATLSATDTESGEGLPINTFSFTLMTESKTTKGQGEVAEQTAAYNVQLTSNNPTTINVTSSALQPGQGHSSIIIEQPEQVIIHENVKVKDSFAVQLGHNNVLGSAQTPESEGSALVGATSAAVSQTQLVIRQPGTVLVYSRKDIDGCENVQIGDNNIMGKLMPQEDAFVRACFELDIDPANADNIFERLSDDHARQQFATLVAERYRVTCNIRSATKGCILLELEVPTEADRLQLLHMARDGTFQQVLLETFLPELAAEGRAVNMNLAIGVRNPSQDMVDEIQGAVASSDHEDVVVVEIPMEKGASKQTDEDLAEAGPKDVLEEEPPDNQQVPVSKAAFKHLSDSEEDSEDATSQDRATASVEEAVQLEEAAANVPREEFDDQFLTCQICMNIYNNPRVLPCLHTFCTRCLEKWQKRKTEFLCPICRNPVKLQGTDVTSLPPNFLINNLLDFRAMQGSEQAHIQCQMCESGARVAGSCRDCNFFLCKNCIGIHGRTQALKDHHITVHDTRTEYCPQHTDQRLMFYCRPCTKLVCRDCTVDEHRPGPNHDPKEVSEAAQEFKAELQTFMEKARHTVDTWIKTDNIIAVEVTSITTNCETVRKETQEHFAQLRAKLDQEERDLGKKLDEMEANIKDPLLEEREMLKETIKSSEEGLQFCTDILTGSNDVEILTLRQQLGDWLNILIAKEISHEGLTEQITFQPNTEMLTFSPGSLSVCNTSILVTTHPVESLSTTVIFRPEKGQVEGSPQVTVTSPGGQCARLDTTETSEGVFEAVWRPQTSGKHQVGVTTGGGGTGEGGGDVANNNPVLRIGEKKGSQQGHLDRPIDVAVSGDRLYVADTVNQRVQVFDLNGKFCSSFPTVANPGSVAVQTDGTIVVRCGKEVKKFSPSGEELHKFPLGEYCTNPYGLAVQRDGRVVVADPDEHSIFLFEADGTLVKQVGGQGKGEGQFDKPYFVCVDKEDNIIVADNHNSRVQAFDRNLNFRHKFGQFGRQPQDMCAPAGVSADSRGNIVLANIGGITDGIRHSKKLQVFRPDGTWVSTISSDGDKLNSPHGVAVTEDGHVFVADYDDNCIRKYRYM
ncbi:uncharacterized protein LOC144906692 [Branchiostoma floridae x Branchiostoma belcheri]